jgi:hypothetical protein
MGIRIAKFEGEDKWIVFQSVTESCYEPIFFDELSAWLYAHHYETIGSQHPDHRSDREFKVGEEIIRFVRESYGGVDDYHDTELYLDEVADVTAGTRRGGQILAELHTAFLEHRLTGIPPAVRTAAEEEK